MQNDPHLFYLIAGEASGDILGARLMLALRERLGGEVRFAGIGGPRMIAAGLDPLFDQAELSHMGLIEILRHIPQILRRIRQTRSAVLRARPAALITIDSPDFCFRVASKLKSAGIPLIHYVAPSVWAWRAGRAQKVAKFLDHILALLPFEPPYFTACGLGCTFVGHPLVESGAAAGQGARFRASRGIAAEVPLLAVLPGSRRGEISHLLPVYAATMARLKTLMPALQIVVPLVPAVAGAVRAAAQGWGVPVHFTETDADKYDAFAACRAALACSGTVSVELALANLPTIIAYKANALTVALYRRFIKVRFATLINIMKDRAVMPEYLQKDCTPEKLSAAVHKLMTDDTLCAAQKNELTQIGAWLGAGAFVPSRKAAETVCAVIEAKQKENLCR